MHIIQHLLYKVLWIFAGSCIGILMAHHLAPLLFTAAICTSRCAMQFVSNFRLRLFNVLDLLQCSFSCNLFGNKT